MEIKVDDDSVTDIARHFLMCCKFIHSARLKGGIVCVYSTRGISRSSSIIISYFMAHLCLSYKDAFTSVHNLRSSTQPNEGFVDQLTSFEKDSLSVRSKLIALEQQSETSNLERKDREWLQKQEEDESWLTEWTDSRVRTITSINPQAAKKDQILLQQFVTTNVFETMKGRHTRSRSLISAFESTRPSGLIRNDVKGPTPISPLKIPNLYKGVNVGAPHPRSSGKAASLEDWDLPHSRSRSATSWETVDKHGNKDLWLPENFVLPPPPRAPGAPGTPVQTSRSTLPSPPPSKS